MGDAGVLVQISQPNFFDATDTSRTILCRLVHEISSEYGVACSHLKISIQLVRKKNELPKIQVGTLNR